MRFGRVEVRPLGGGMGCMIVVSLLLSLVLTLLVNAVL